MDFLEFLKEELQRAIDNEQAKAFKLPPYDKENDMGIKNIDGLVDDFGKKYAMALENAKAQAAEQGCGVMTIGADEVLVCEYVPAGRVLHASSKEAYLKFLEKNRPEDN